MTYDNIIILSSIASLLLFGGMFIGVLIYALRPTGKAKFEDHGRIPLKEDKTWHPTKTSMSIRAAKPPVTNGTVSKS